MTAVQKTVTLRNGVEMPLVGLGVIHNYGSECVRSICEAVEIGCRMIDTAAVPSRSGLPGSLSHPSAPGRYLRLLAGYGGAAG